MKSNTNQASLGHYNNQDSFANHVSHSGGGVWEKLTLTHTVNTAAPTDFRMRIGMSQSGNATIASGDYFEVTEAQLELGSVATDFEHRSYGEELALCQRYFWRTTGSDYAGIGSGHVKTAITLRVVIPNPVEMRTNGSLSISGTLRANTADTTIDITQLQAAWTGKVSSMVEFTQSGLTSGYGVILHHQNNTSNYLQVDAEL
tara:strand:- start:75 stop:680 length:606 start_codon:yes stop_codon:yes gene_type:complete